MEIFNRDLQLQNVMHTWPRNKRTGHGMFWKRSLRIFYSGPKWFIDFRKTPSRLQWTICGGKLHYRLMHYTVFEVALHVMTYAIFALLLSRGLRGISPSRLCRIKNIVGHSQTGLLTRRQIAHFIFTHRHTRMHIGRFYKRNVCSLNASDINKCLKIRCT